jgi:hypothetical protein
MNEIPIIRLAAANLKNNADRFRLNFVSNYLNKNKPFLIRTFIETTDLLPIGLAAQRLLLSRKQFEIHQGNMTNNVGREVELQYKPSINRSQFDISVRFPKPFKANISSSADSLIFSLTTPLDVAFVTLPQTPGAEIIPQFCKTLKLSITSDEIIYEFHTQTEGVPVFYIVADMRTAKPNAVDFTEMVKNLSSSNESFLTGLSERNPNQFPVTTNYKTVSIGICDCGTQAYTQTTPHCVGKTRTLDCLGGQHTYTYDCICDKVKFEQIVQAGNDEEADQLVEDGLPC